MKLKLSIFLSTLALATFAQEPCGYSTKKFEQSVEEILKSKTSDEGKIDLLLDKADNNGESALLWFELGRLQFLQAENAESPQYGPALRSLEKSYELCPELNPLLDYYLGIIYYANQDFKKSLQRFKKFVESEKNPWDKGHESKLQDVKSSIPQIEQEMKADTRFISAEEAVKASKLMKVSTALSEYLPALSPDNSILLFTRKKVSSGMGELTEREIEEFTEAHKDENAFSFDLGTPLPPPFNQGGNYGGATMSVNNREMFLTVCIPLESGYKNCDIYSTRYTKYRPDPKSTEMAWQWTDLKNLGPKINSEMSWEAQPSISSDGQTLYFAKFEKDKTRNIDLYYSTKDATGEWQEAQPMPAPINSDAADKAPFIHPDGKSLYFSSGGHKGEGGLDIYLSTKVDSVNWSNPVNVGLPVNSAGDEHGLLVSTDGKYALYSSNAADGGNSPFDIYYVELPAKARPEEIIFIRGKVDSASADTKLELKNMEGAKIRDIEIDQSDGVYAAVISKKELQKPLILGIDQQGAAFEAQIIDESKVKNGTIDNESMQVNSMQSNQPYTIKDINFKTNSAEVLDISKPILNEFAKFLQKNPSISVEIRGHTDNTGDPASNRELSVQRALSVEKYLISKGVPASRLSHQGFGDSEPIDSNGTEKGKARNRRTEFVIL